MSKKSLLRGARVYLSGPMDFVADRVEEAKNGWRARIGQILKDKGVIVFDPWQKPDVRGLHEYGKETIDSGDKREEWTYAADDEGAKKRHEITGHYWPTLHIDLRMVDTCDFVIAYCPTNVYSVGTPHEIALARQQRKPVLFVSPPVEFPALKELQDHLAKTNDEKGKELLAKLANEVPIKPNPKGIPSLWYMPLVGGQGFFNSFGFDHADYRKRYEWKESALDIRERNMTQKRSLLPFLDLLEEKLPEKWSRNGWTRNDDWLLWDLKDGSGKEGAEVTGAKGT